MNDTHNYDDIIQMQHHRSAVHPHMSRHDRAAQFSPFAALTGHSAALSETERLTDQMIELNEDAKEKLDMVLQYIQADIEKHPQISVTYFEPDTRKEGGAYVNVDGAVKSIDRYERVIRLEDGRILDIDRIIECNIRQDILKDEE